MSIHLESLKVDEVVGKSQERNGENGRQRTYFHPFGGVGESATRSAFVPIIPVHHLHVDEHALCQVITRDR